MRIAFITPEYVSEGYFSGGLANYVNRVATALAEMGHVVHVITLSEETSDTIEPNGVRVHRVALRGKGKLFNRLTGGRLRDTRNWVAFARLAAARARAIHGEAPLDLVQCPNSRGCGLGATLLLSVPTVVRISCYRPAWNEHSGATPTLDTRATEWLEWWQLKLSRHIYGPSECLRTMLAEDAGIRNVDLIRTPFYVEVPELDPSVYEEQLQGKRYLLFFGRFQLHKGVHILAQALPRVLDACPDLHACFVGIDRKSKLAPSMREYATELCGEHADRLVFIGQTRHAQLYPIIQHARLVVLPSLVDNLPNTCLESMALGRAVIGTRGASFDELIEDGTSGFLVPIGDADALAQKIIDVWGREDLDVIGERARGVIEEFSPEKTVKALVAYYERVVDGTG